ncbi:MAG: copper chaperone PCu(A)C [Pseudomonas sp.]|uniref:copper chaperone PCu(A)C n=1 Tax=Pseudomonas sp. TaxID=306 RepID=UPI00391CBE07
MTAVQHLKRLTLSLALSGFAAHASAEVQVTDAWVRASVPGQPSSGAFMTLTADTDSQLLRVASPVAKDVQIHEMSMKDDVMRMGPVDSVALPAGQAVKLDPNGYHVMLMGLTGQIKEGDQVPLTLTVENAKGEKHSVDVSATARGLDGVDHSHMDHSKMH